jgi:hypothetical protein
MAPADGPSADVPPSEAETLLKGDGQILSVGGGYRLRRPLGRGAFGEVWKAEAPGGVEVAVKLILRDIRPAEAQRELDALQLMKRLRHHNLLALQAFFPLPDRLIIVLELADRSLRGRLAQCQETGLPGIPPAELLRYFREAAEALDFLHGAERAAPRRQAGQHSATWPARQGGRLRPGQAAGAEPAADR